MKFLEMNQDVLYRYLRAATTPEEEIQILEWLDADPAKHRKELNAFRYTLSALDTYHSAVGARRTRTRGLIRRIAVYAASAAAVIALVVGASYYGQRYSLAEISSRKIALTIPYGQRMQITLEDGSQVWLNAGAHLEYPAVFGNGQRRVRLSGEAMFAVHHDSSHPFIVETFASEIEVLGTRFNVIANEYLGQFATALLDGAVKVVGTKNQETLYMQPNEEVVLVNGRFLKSKIDDPVALQWTTGIISVRGLTFLELMTKFEKAYGVKIEVRCKVMPRLELHSGKIRISDGIEHALRVLQLAADFKYTRNDQSNLIVIE